MLENFEDVLYNKKRKYIFQIKGSDDINAIELFMPQGFDFCKKDQSRLFIACSDVVYPMRFERTAFRVGV